MHSWVKVGLSACVAAGVLAAGCGSSGPTSVFDNGNGAGDGGALSDGSGTNPGTGFDDDSGGGITPQCTPITCAQAGVNCGPVADGCGGLAQCGTCTPPASCGGGGFPSQCGGTAACIPRTCTDLAAACGQQGDGCGNIIDCGTCAAPASCGGGGTASQCGAGGTCVKKTACDAGATCGVQADGCGGTIPCGANGGACPSGQQCGANQQANVCGVPVCKPKTCADYPGTCGVQGDGCGGLTAACGACTAPATCGGAGVPSQCGVPRNSTVPCFGGTCTQTACAAGTSTTITGTIYDPAGRNPLYDVVAYIPQTAPQPFKTTVACDSCASLFTGNPIVAATTDALGHFTITNAPSGTNVPLVLQVGKWRKITTIATVNPCVANAIPDVTAGVKTLTLPKNRTVGDIPNMAVSTGGFDTLECLLRRIGVDAGEYTGGAAGAGRIHIYKGSTYNSDGAHATVPSMPGATSSSASLWDSAVHLDAYDLLLLSCEGGETVGSDGNVINAAAQQRLFDYAALGGRVFASHYHYKWFNTGAFGAQNLATWTTGLGFNPFANGGTAPNVNASIVTTLPNGQAFSRGVAMKAWLANVGALDANGLIDLTYVAHNADVTAANGASQPFISQSTTAPNPTTYFSFNTPFGVPEASQCGRAVYSDLHVGAASNDAFSTSVPSGCANQPLSNQEKALEFMLFDLSACVQPNGLPPFTPGCTKVSCGTANCGQISDGCGGVQDCGVCTPPQTCGGGGVANVCGGTCIPKTCASYSAGTCGPQSDGCGGVTPDCACPTGQTCGGGGLAGVCGVVSCTPKTCAQVNATCGQAGDGCGGLTASCGTCPPGQVCGGGGVYNQCGAGTCTARTCAQAGAECGQTGDGCGGVLACGDCGGGTCIGNTCSGLH